jgi:hypothetical protein
MHSICYDILQQAFMRIATGQRLEPKTLWTFFADQPLSQGENSFKPVWSDIGYGGAEHLSLYEWNTLCDPMQPRNWNHLIYDPTSVEEDGGLLANLPLILVFGDLHTSPAITTSSHTDKDVFRILPFEIRINILCLLPAASIRAVQLASRAMASHTHDELVFKSRFAYPHELSHIPILEGHFAGPAIRVNWPRLVNSLLYSTSRGRDKNDLPASRNRQRIFDIATQLAQKLLAKLSPDGSQTLHDPFSDASLRRKILRLSSSPTTRRDRINFQDLRMHEVSEIVSYYQKKRSQNECHTLTGIEFLSTAGYNYRMRKLGSRCHREVHAALPDLLRNGACSFLGFAVAMSNKKIVDIDLCLLVDGLDGKRNNMQDALKKLSAKHPGSEFAKMVVSEGCTVYGFEMTTFGVSGPAQYTSCITPQSLGNES